MHRARHPRPELEVAGQLADAVLAILDRLGGVRGRLLQPAQGPLDLVEDEVGRAHPDHADGQEREQHRRHPAEVHGEPVDHGIDQHGGQDARGRPGQRPVRSHEHPLGDHQADDGAHDGEGRAPRAARVAVPRSPSGWPSRRTVPTVSSSSGEGAALDPTPTRVIDVHPASVAVFSAVAALAAAVWAIVTIAPDMVTRAAVGIVLGVALSPLSSAVQRRFHRSPTTAAAIVGGGMVLFFAGVVLLVAPPAVDQARDFSDELPATVRDLYSWPILGDRLAEADAAGQVQEAIDELPARIDDETLAALGERLLGGALSTVVVVITAIGVLADGGVMVRRLRAIVPPSRQARADEMGQIVYHSFGSYFAGVPGRGRPQRPGDPHLRSGPRGPARPDRGDLVHPHQLHPTDRWVPGWVVLRPPGPHPEPGEGRHRGRGVPAVPAVREQRRGAGDRRERGEPHATHHDAGRPGGRGRGRGAGRPRGHPAGGGGEGPLPRATQGAAPAQGRRAQAAAQGSAWRA